jgi:hypothetical protein
MPEVTCLLNGAGAARPQTIGDLFSAQLMTRYVEGKVGASRD